MKKIKSITFDKEAQENLPQHIKDKMLLQRKQTRNTKLSLNVEDLITDLALEIVFNNTNFGGISYREVVLINLKKISDGYSIGRTAKICLIELGLIYSESNNHCKVSLLGNKYLEISENQNFTCKNPSEHCTFFHGGLVSIDGTSPCDKCK